MAIPTTENRRDQDGTGQGYLDFILSTDRNLVDYHESNRSVERVADLDQLLEGDRRVLPAGTGTLTVFEQRAVEHLDRVFSAQVAAKLFVLGYRADFRLCAWGGYDCYWLERHRCDCDEPEASFLFNHLTNAESMVNDEKDEKLKIPKKESS